MKKDLILTIASKYSIYQLEPYFRSLRKAGFKGDIVVFYARLTEKTLNLLKKYGIKFKKFDEVVFNGKKINLLNYRFKLYYDFLKEHQKEYNQVFISDVRDIVFQSNPFLYPEYAKINYFFENKRIKDCAINSYVFKKASSQRDFDKYSNKYIICAGTTVGNKENMLNYLKLMKIKLENESEPIDQGYHNFLLHSQKIKGAKGFYNFSGPVLTLNDVPYSEILFNSEGQIINKDNSIISVLHQYDRHIRLLFKYNNFKEFLFTALRAAQIKTRRLIKMFLFRTPLIGKKFTQKYFDPTRFS